MEQQPRTERSQRSRVVRWALALSLCLLVVLGAFGVYMVRSRAATPTCAASCPLLLYGGNTGLTTAPGQVTGIRQSDGATLWNTPLTNLGNAYLASGASGEAYLATMNCAVRPCTHWIVALRVRDGALLWHVQITGTVLYMITASVGVYAENFDDIHSTLVFHALSAGTGASLWHAPAGMRSFTPLAISNGTLYVAATDATFNRSLLAVRDDTGIPVFHVVLPYVFAVPPSSVSPSSTGVIYASINESPGNALIYAISARDGAILWKHTLPPSGVRGGWEDLSLTQSALLVVEPYNVYALDRTTGTVRWHFPVPAAAFALGTADSARVYLFLTGQSNWPAGTRPETTTLRALDPRTGATLWSRSASLYNQDFTLANGSLFISQTALPASTCTPNCVAKDGPTTVCALDVATGATSWCARQSRPGTILAAD
ncbi:MAG: PQQ-binding-like beta-propeller repeat protein [Ktedonobacterales bacterium]